GVGDLAGAVDFVLAFAVVHELPSVAAFFEEAFAALKPGGRLLLAEPALHVTGTAFDGELAEACRAGFTVLERPKIRQCRAALLER
ncbi:MAG TPA: methyltransferase domain-containing protein, partial [Holophaga sp.]|nr:methyltransferase domain-containing protein [Holophaga sp.]